jgi:hypothetical protein
VPIGQPLDLIDCQRCSQSGGEWIYETRGNTRVARCESRKDSDLALLALGVGAVILLWAALK